jgi:hypothetical protein
MVQAIMCKCPDCKEVIDISMMPNHDCPAANNPEEWDSPTDDDFMDRFWSDGGEK